MRTTFFILLLASGMGIASCSSSRETTNGADSTMTNDTVGTTGAGTVTDTTRTDTVGTTGTQDTTGTGTGGGTTNPPRH